MLTALYILIFMCLGRRW